MRVIIDAAYPNRMSYLEEWRKGWLSQPDQQNIYINIAKLATIARNRRLIGSADQIVVLHSCTADTNNWLKPYIDALGKRNGKLVFYVGNEYSSPTVSMDVRLQLITEIFPEVLASQLPITAAKWLYKNTSKLIVSSPQGMPAPIQKQKKSFDFSYRGFKYPSFILGNQRNDISDSVSKEFISRGLVSNYSLSERLSKDRWMDLLAGTRVTAASQAGSSRVFKSDAVWDSLRHHPDIRFVNSDNYVVHLARLLPHDLKSKIRVKISRGKNIYGSLHDDSASSLLLKNQVLNSSLPSVDGRAISSRHFDAIAAGCWQILEVGDYNGILSPWTDYTPIEDTSPSAVKDSVDHALEMSNSGNLAEMQERIFSTNSYDHRIKSLITFLS